MWSGACSEARRSRRSVQTRGGSLFSLMYMMKKNPCLIHSLLDRGPPPPILLKFLVKAPHSAATAAAIRVFNSVTYHIKINFAKIPSKINKMCSQISSSRLEFVQLWREYVRTYVHFLSIIATGSTEKKKWLVEVIDKYNIFIYFSFIAGILSVFFIFTFWYDTWEKCAYSRKILLGRVKRQNTKHVSSKFLPWHDQ